jgi:mono/diheme cytochrome c family protein
MKKNVNKLLAFSLPAVMALVMVSCGEGDPNSPGIEYMPDMYRSPSLETNIASHWTDSTMANRLPAPHTVRRSWVTEADKALLDKNGYPASIWFPYMYEDSPKGDSLASIENKDPLPQDSATEAKGEYLYGQFCIHCHGAQGHGDGTIVANKKFPATPPDYTKKTSMTEGHIYQVIMYGKGVMGSHASQLEPLERWQIVRYVQKLQRGGKSVAEFNHDQMVADSTAKAAAAAEAKNTKPAK